MEDIRVNAGRVDDITGLIFTVIGADLPDSLFKFERFYLCVKEEINAVHIGVLSHGDVEHERTDNAAGGRVQSACHFLRQVGLQLQALLPVQKAELFDAVGDTSVIQGLQAADLRLMDADDQGAVPLEGNIQISGQISHHLIAPYIHLCHHGAFGRVKAGVYDRAVGLGSTAANIFIFFQNAGIEVIAGQLSGHCCSCNTCAYDNYIV